MKTIKSLSLVALFLGASNAFVAPSVNTVAFSKAAAPTPFIEMNMMDPVTASALSMDMETVSTVINTVPSLMLSETESWVQPLSQVLGPFFNLFSFAMLCRVVISWYPSAKLNEFPYNIAVWPTEPLLMAIRGSVPPAFGVDITPIIWLAIFTFFNEILLGQQGLLTMKIKYGI